MLTDAKNTTSVEITFFMSFRSFFNEKTCPTRNLKHLTTLYRTTLTVNSISKAVNNISEGSARFGSTPEFVGLALRIHPKVRAAPLGMPPGQAHHAEKWVTGNAVPFLLIGSWWAKTANTSGTNTKLTTAVEAYFADLGRMRGLGPPRQGSGRTIRRWRVCSTP